MNHLNQEQIHVHIETHLHVDTLVASHLTELHIIKTYADFCKALKLVDDTHLHNALLLQEAIVRVMSTNSANMACCERATRNYTNTTTSPATTTTPCLPPLTNTECALLTEHLGCFKCHCFFAPHISCDCD